MSKPDPNRFHLAQRVKGGLSHFRGPFIRATADRKLCDLMSDPPDDRDETLCVVEWSGKWEDAEIVLTAEEVLAEGQVG